MTSRIFPLSSLISIVTASLLFTSGIYAQDTNLNSVTVTRLLDQPIIRPDLHPSIGQNIQGPSLIRVPEWVEDPLGKYYLYFADHKGRYIRLAYADELAGPWRIHVSGTLPIEQSYFASTPLLSPMSNLPS